MTVVHVQKLPAKCIDLVKDIEESTTSLMTASTALCSSTLTMSTPEDEEEALLTPRETKVKFHGVNVRIFARSLGDNPAARRGPPLGLDWQYKDLTQNDALDSIGVRKPSGPNNAKEEEEEEDAASTTGPESDTDEATEETKTELEDDAEDPMLIPMDVYEKQANRRRRNRLMQTLKLREKSQKQLKAVQRTVQRRASSGFFMVPKDLLEGLDEEEVVDDDDDDGLLSEDEINQLSAKWLKLQPVSAKKREKILLQETDTTKREIEARKKELFKMRQQRASTIAMAETGLDDWLVIAELIKRRFRRLKTGISKEKEQELLWEKAREYFSEKKDVGGEEKASPLTEQAPPQPVAPTAA